MIWLEQHEGEFSFWIIEVRHGWKIEVNAVGRIGATMFALNTSFILIVDLNCSISFRTYTR
jgi:hypothetical protein